MTFTPTLLGTELSFESGHTGMITDETPDSVYIESAFFTGWVSKETLFNYIES